MEDRNKKEELDVLLNGATSVNHDIEKIAEVLGNYALAHPDDAEMFLGVIQNLGDITKKNGGVSHGVIEFAGMSKKDENEYLESLASNVASSMSYIDSVSGEVYNIMPKVESKNAALFM